MNRLALSPSFATTIDIPPMREWFPRLRATAFGRALIGSAVIHALLIALVPGFRQALPRLPLPERLDVLLRPRAEVPPPLDATAPQPQPQTRAQPQTQRADQRPIQRRVEARAPAPRMPAQRMVSPAPSPVEPAIASAAPTPAETVRSSEPAPMPEALRQAEAPPPRPAPSAVAPSDGLIAAYGSGFKAAVDKNRRYPRVAQARGWQGTATVLVKVLPGGRLGDVSIARSSGVDLLDDTARDMVKTAQLPALPEALRDHGFEIRVPVEFRLL